MSVVAARDVTCRPETDADAAFRLALFCDSRHPCESLVGLDRALADQLMRHQLAGQTASYRAHYPRARRDIVEVEGTPVGRIVVDEAGGAWTLVDIALLRAWRGGGIGTRLLEQTMAGAQAAGASLRLRVMAYNADATRLYARLGFVAVAGDGIAVELLWTPATAERA